MKLARKISNGTLLAAVAFTAVAAQDQSVTDEQWIARMQQHWERVITEEDPAQRRELLREHEELMTQAADERGMGGMSGMGDHTRAGEHTDLMNSIDMHRHMMDMMR